MENYSVALVTLGCAKNLVDTDIMKSILELNKYNIVDNNEDAEIIIVNTCGFIETAKQESIATILDIAELKKTNNLKYLIVAGCLAQRYHDELLKEIPEIDRIVGTGEFKNIKEILQNIAIDDQAVYIGNLTLSYEDFKEYYKNRKAGVSAFVKIAEGCDNYCTFCIIPKLRGPYRSRTIESIYNEVLSLAKNGTKEINLVAQDTSIYGQDIYGKPQIANLLTKLNDVDGIEWIRLLYTYPSQLNDELINAIKNLPKVCKYIEIPLQHSEDKILKLMNRPDKKSDIINLINKIRDRIPEVVIRTTIIVGFPNETEEDYSELKKFINDIKFDRLGVFAYSLEENTAAANLKNHVDENIKERRVFEINSLQNKITEKSNSHYIGKVLEVLIERKEDDFTYVGRTKFDAPEIDSEVFVNSKKEILLGSILKVKITHALDYDMTGEVLIDESC